MHSKRVLIAKRPLQPRDHPGFEVAGVFPVGNIWPESPDTLTFFVLLKPLA